MRRAISLLLFVLAGGTALWFAASYSHELGRIREVPPADLITLSLLVLAVFGVNGLVIRSYCRLFGVPLEVVEWYGLSVVQTMGNYMPWRAGALAQMAYVRVRYGLPVLRVLSGLGATAISTMLASGVLGMVATTAVIWEGSAPPRALLAVFAIATTGAFALLQWPRSWPRARRRLPGWLSSALEAWQMVRSDARLLRRLLVLSLSAVVLYGFRLFVAFHALGYPASLSHVLVIAPLVSISGVLSIVPAGLGLREAIVGLTSAALGIGFPGGVYAAALDRAVSVVWVVLLGSVFGQVLAARAGRTPAASRQVGR